MDPTASGKLNCALTRYLEKQSIECGEKAQFAAAVLADLGCFDSNKPHIEDLKLSLKIIATLRDTGLMTEMRRTCASCPYAATCPVGNTVLAR
ncbi:MAG: hypothetical protein JNJ60_24855 [Rhodocyclaceae bacterium]|nr:hypothetical protein [Rhodocyclaceae bacterium]